MEEFLTISDSHIGFGQIVLYYEQFYKCTKLRRLHEMESKGNKQPQLDFLPLTLSITTLGGMSTSLIRRGTPLPVKRSQVFSTAMDNQKSVQIKVLLGERPLADKNKPILSCVLEDIPAAPRGMPQIRVTVEVDRFCNVKVEAIEKTEGKKIETTLEKSSVNLTNGLIQQLLNEAEENREEDDARSVIASAELRIRKDQEQNSVTATTRNIEKLIANIGIALMESNKAQISSRTKQLETLLAESQETYSPFGGLGSLFDSFFAPKQLKKQTERRQTPADSKTMKSERMNSVPVVQTSNTSLIQSFLETVDPELELKRAGAWEAVGSNRPDGCVQASHSMREVLRQFLAKLAPTEEVVKASWYRKPEDGAPVTRAMRIRYVLAGSDVVSESTLSLTNDLAAAVHSMYAKLSAESHGSKGATIPATRIYLNACEAVIGLIAIQRHR